MLISNISFNIKNTIPYIAGHSTPGPLQILDVFGYTRGYITQVDTIYRGVQEL